MVIRPSHGWVSLGLGELWGARELVAFFAGSEIRVRYKQTLIGAILHDDKLIVPKGNDRIRMGDHVVIFTTRSAFSEVQRLIAD